MRSGICGWHAHKQQAALQRRMTVEVQVTHSPRVVHAKHHLATNRIQCRPTVLSQSLRQVGLVAAHIVGLYDFSRENADRISASNDASSCSPNGKGCVSSWAARVFLQFQQNENRDMPRMFRGPIAHLLQSLHQCQNRGQ